MSKVLTEAKNRYQKAMIIESVCLVVFGLLVALWQGESAVDFSLGFICAFVPFCAFTYIVFFRKDVRSDPHTPPDYYGSMHTGSVRPHNTCPH